MRLSDAIKTTDRKVREQKLRTLQELTDTIPCNWENCITWKQGRCGSRMPKSIKMKPPKYCNCTLQSSFFLFPDYQKENRGGRFC